MKEYLLVIAAVLILSWLKERTYIIAPHSPSTVLKNRFSLILIFSLLSIFIGLRTSYNDTFAYISSYNQLHSFPSFWDSFSPILGDNPGFNIASVWLKTHHFSAQSYILLCTAASLIFVVYFINRYSVDLPLSFFLFFATNAYTLHAAAIKQVLAISIGLIAVKYAAEKKWVWFYVLLFLASTFHPYILIYLIVPFLYFRPWTRRTFLWLGIFIAAGLSLESLLGSIIDLTALVGDTYSEDALVGEGINIFRVLVSNAPLALSFLYRKRLFQNSSGADNLIMNLSMINGAIMFMGLFGTAIYFSRMASFFLVFQCISIPWIINQLPPRKRTFYKSIVIVGYIGFFIYANILSQSFDANFSRITLWKYLQNTIMR